MQPPHPQHEGQVTRLSLHLLFFLHPMKKKLVNGVLSDAFVSSHCYFAG